MIIRACIFDLDGVIVDSAKYHYKAWRTLAESVGVPFSEEENEKLKGVGRMESLQHILSLGNIDKSETEKIALASDKNDHYLSLIEAMNESEILPGVCDFLKELKASNIQIALGSSSKNAQMILKKLGLTSFFEVIIDGTKTTKSKPDPQVFNLGAEQLGRLPKETVVFEDAIKGIEAANKGGFNSVGVGDPETLISADHVIPGFNDFRLPNLISLFQ